METIPHDSPIYRSISKKWWIKNNIVSPSAFLLRRETKDGTPEKELSVNTSANCTKEFCVAQLSDCYGELKLFTEKINELGLEIISNPLPKNPHHALIINLPLNVEETIKEAERIAGLLAKRVANIQLRPK